MNLRYHGENSTQTEIQTHTIDLIITHKSVFVRDVVGQFQLVKRHHSGHPVLSGGRAVRVNVHALGQLRVGFSCHGPARLMKLVPAAVRRHHVHQQHVARSLVQTTAAHTQRRKHPPHRRREGNKKTQLC